MLWQATAGMRFRLLGGYALHPNEQGTVTLSPPQLSPTPVQQFLERAELGPEGDPGLSTLAKEFDAGVHEYLRKYDVGTVIVDLSVTNSGIAANAFRAALGPPLLVGGVAAWFDLGGGR
jgi:Flp pilus assembly CpaE family ATPase